MIGKRIRMTTRICAVCITQKYVFKINIFDKHIRLLSTVFKSSARKTRALDVGR